MLANLGGSSSTSLSGASTSPALALVPFLTPAQFIDAFRKSKLASHAAQLLNASSTHVVGQLSDHDMKDVIMVIYRLLIRANQRRRGRPSIRGPVTSHVRACAGVWPRPSPRVWVCRVPQAVCRCGTASERARCAVAQVRGCGAVWRVPCRPAGRGRGAGTSPRYACALVLQYRVLVSEADKMKDQAVGVQVKQKCFADQARAAGLVVKYFLRRVGEMEKMDMVEYVWEIVSGAVGGLVTGSAANEVLVETAVPTLENAVRVLHSLGLMTDPKTGKPSQLWKITKSKLGKVLPGLEESLFPSSPAGGTVADAPRSTSPRPQSPPVTAAEAHAAQAQLPLGPRHHPCRFLGHHRQSFLLRHRFSSSNRSLPTLWYRVLRLLLQRQRNPWLLSQTRMRHPMCLTFD
ncbi:hypothetical protein BCR44DRAFT_1142505 [Catenaria anguillulae PL171]|uniref:Uncharacterized protein n=1 Tax=Catenaria anguillulae PL171 TaxID=765915 RepID=A0A1Y2HJC2_9FUNG|nr:hypothetical protein BCR44DRAFT_1142505 [Catenaria anguillulae PL171]